MEPEISDIPTQKDKNDIEVKENEAAEFAGNTEAANLVNLPPATKKYILVLDLDETLIHSHVRYKVQLANKE